MTEAKNFETPISAWTEQIVDRGKGIKVVLGVPTKPVLRDQFNSPGVESLFTPSTPYIFNVDELTVTDKEHNKEKIADVNVLMAHGIREAGEWKFLDGQEVVETVSAYNKYAGENKLKPVEFLVVCNEEAPDESGVKVGPFDALSNMAYAVGENVNLYGGDQSRVEDGKVFMDVSVNDTFFGLDKLIDTKKLQPDIKIL
jgi:hypothetical protein